MTKSLASGSDELAEASHPTRTRFQFTLITTFVIISGIAVWLSIGKYSGRNMPLAIYIGFLLPTCAVCGCILNQKVRLGISILLASGLWTAIVASYQPFYYQWYCFFVVLAGVAAGSCTGLLMRKGTLLGAMLGGAVALPTLVAFCEPRTLGAWITSCVVAGAVSAVPFVLTISALLNMQRICLKIISICCHRPTGLKMTPSPKHNTDEGCDEKKQGALPPSNGGPEN